MSAFIGGGQESWAGRGCYLLTATSTSSQSAGWTLPLMRLAEGGDGGVVVSAPLRFAGGLDIFFACQLPTHAQIAERQNGDAEDGSTRANAQDTRQTNRSGAAKESTALLKRRGQ